MTENNPEEKFNQMLDVLKFPTLERLGQMLNGRKHLSTKDRKLRDWRGLVDFIGLDSSERLQVESSSNFTAKIITIWCNKETSKAQVKDLITCLQTLDRYDVIHDLEPLFVQDCEAAQGLPVVSLKNTAGYENTISITDYKSLSSGAPLQRYDAMVLFTDKDLEFGMHVVQRMEAAGLNVFVSQRDLMAGTAEHVASAEIIHRRCGSVVAIFSPSFVKSAENLFFLNFAQHVGFTNRETKIIPVIYRECKLPTQYSMYHVLPYKKESSIFNFWVKLLEKTYCVEKLDPKLKMYDLVNFEPTIGQRVIQEEPRAPVLDDKTKNVQSEGAIKNSDDSLDKKLPNPPTEEPGPKGEKNGKPKDKKYGGFSRLFKRKKAKELNE